jgi:hypothetical protein
MTACVNQWEEPVAIKAQPAEEKTDNLRPIGLRLEPETIRQLRVAYGGKPGAKLSDEIRKRLRWTLDIEPIDEPTKEFLKDIALLATEIELETGSQWHSHPGSFVAFRQAILSRLARLKPPGKDLKFGPRPRRTVPGDTPEEIGVWAEFEIHTMRDAPAKVRANYRLAKEGSWGEIVRLKQEKNEGQS